MYNYITKFLGLGNVSVENPGKPVVYKQPRHWYLMKPPRKATALFCSKPTVATKALQRAKIVI